MEMTSITLRKDLVDNVEQYLSKSGLNWETFLKNSLQTNQENLSTELKSRLDDVEQGINMSKKCQSIDDIWDNIEEVEPTEEEKNVIEKYLAGDGEYVVN